MNAENGTPAAAAPSVLPGYFADPHLTVLDGRFYLFPTSDGFADWSATEFRAFSSSDLVLWIDHGSVFSLPDDTRWARAHAWAPAVAQRNGLYYFYFTAEMESIGVAVAESPTGPYRDLGRPLISEGQYSGRAIDPAVFVDADGTTYLLWGNGVLHLVALAEDMTSFDADAVTSWTPTGFREAAWIHRRGDIYYLSWCENDTREETYRVRYATSGSLKGPWLDHGVLLEKSSERGILATGHHSIMQIPATDEWFIAYHRFAIPDGTGYRRELAIDRLVHREDGLLQKVEPSRAPVTRELDTI